MPEPTDLPPLPWQQIIERATVVVIDGSTMPDPETGQPRPAITVRMPAYVAESWARALAAWSAIGEMVEETWRGDELATVATLQAAADVARRVGDRQS